jgi:hypothetical protein
MYLTTGKQLSRQQWDELPMPDGVIAAVEAMAASEHQPLLENGGPIFEWSPGIAIEDEDEAEAQIVIIDEQNEGNHQDIIEENVDEPHNVVEVGDTTDDNDDEVESGPDEDTDNNDEDIDDNNDADETDGNVMDGGEKSSEGESDESELGVEDMFEED